MTKMRTIAIDGLVLANVCDPQVLDQIACYGISPIPLLRRGIPTALTRRLESKARHIAYRTLAPQTGTALDIADSIEIARAMRSEAQKPYLLGFGLRHRLELISLAPYTDGFVIGSEFIRRVRRSSRDECLRATRDCIRDWKSAIV